MKKCIRECENEIERLMALLSGSSLSDKDRKSYECDLAYEQKRLQDLKKEMAEHTAFA